MNSGKVTPDMIGKKWPPPPERHLDSNPAVILQPWEPGDEACVMCDEPHSSFGGVDTLQGWICYECIRWMAPLVKSLRAVMDDNPDWKAEMDATP